MISYKDLNQIAINFEYIIEDLEIRLKQTEKLVVKLLKNECECIFKKNCKDVIIK